MTLQPGQSLALLNSDWVHQQAQRLADSIGAVDLSNEDIVKQSVQAILSRDATIEELTDGDQLIKDLQTKHKLDRKRAVQLYCLSVMNWNEFLFVD